MVGVQQFLCKLGHRLAEIGVIQHVDFLVFVRIAQRAETVKAVQHVAARVSKLVLFERNRLTAAADTAARTCHDFYEVIVYLVGQNCLNQLAGIAQSAGNRTTDGRAVEVEFRLAPAFLTANGAECVSRCVFAHNRVVCRAQSGFHDAAGRAEDNAGTGADTERRIKLCFRQAEHVDVLHAHQAIHLTGCENNVHILHAVLSVAVKDVSVLFRLFGDTRHNRNAANLFRIYAHLFCEIGLGNRAEHLHRALCRGNLRHELRILRLDKTHPARAARGKHRQILELAVLQALEEFCGFFHDGQVRRERGVKYIVKAHRAQNGGQTANRCHLTRQTVCFAPSGANSRCNLYHGDFVRIAQCVEDFAGIVALTQCADRTVGDALAAQRTVRVLDAAVVCDIDGGAGTGTAHAPDTQCLDFFTVLHAAHTFDALLYIAVQRERLRPNAVGQVFFIWILEQTKVVGYLL